MSVQLTKTQSKANANTRSA